MAHDYAYKLRLDSEGSGTLISTWADMTRIAPEESPPLRFRSTVIANRHGDLSPSRFFYDNYDFSLEIMLSYGTPETTTTVYSNRSEVLQRLTNHTQTVWLQRNTGHQGNVEIPIRVIRGPRTSNPDHLLSIICHTIDPFWRDQALTFSAVNPVSGVTNNGDAPIADSVIVLSGFSGTQRLTNTTTGEWVEVNADTTTNAITIDCGARTIVQSGSPADDTSNFAASDEWLIEVVPGANTFTLSGSGSATLTAREKWL
jgi:hypothetical protein